jgi:predicted ATPase
MLLKGTNIGVFEEVNIDIAKLTLIAGENASGKSTISKIIYLLIKGNGNFKAYLKRDLLFQLSRLESVLSDFLFSISPSIDLFGDELVEENLDDEIKEDIAKFEHLISRIIVFTDKIKDSFSTDIVLDILEFYKNKDVVKYVDSEDISLLEDYLENNNESKISKIILSRIIKAEFDNQLTKFNSNEMEVFLENESNKSFIKLLNKKYDFNFSELGFSSVFYIGNGTVLDETSNLRTRRSLSSIRRTRGKLIVQRDHSYDLSNTVQSRDSEITLKEEIAKNDFIEKFDGIIKNIIGGTFEYDEELRKFYFYDGKNNIDLKNVASGAKSLAALELLIKNGSINDSSFLILDEPENNLHPMWQIKFAKLILEFIEKTNMKIIINSHSPYFIDAINQISFKFKNLENQINYYQITNVNEKYSLKNCTDNINELFTKLAEPYDYLERELNL